VARGHSARCLPYKWLVVNRLYAFVAERARHRCEYRHAPEAVFNFPFEVEHVIPAGRLGQDEEGNLALACRACNLRRADHIVGEDFKWKLANNGYVWAP
jgi:hypothetical protein